MDTDDSATNGLESKETKIFCLWVQSTEYLNVNSLAMEEAAQKATSYAQHQGDDFYQPAFEEPPLYKESTPHTPQQQVIIDTN